MAAEEVEVEVVKGLVGVDVKVRREVVVTTVLVVGTVWYISTRRMAIHTTTTILDTITVTSRG